MAGCLGWFYYLGKGVKKDVDAAYECWKEAAERGNVHAMGCLVMLYFNRKLYNKAAQLAHRCEPIIQGIISDEIYLMFTNPTTCPELSILTYSTVKNRKSGCEWSRFSTVDSWGGGGGGVEKWTNRNFPLCSPESRCHR